VDQRKREEYRTASRAFAAALLVARRMPDGEGRDLRALALLNLSLLGALGVVQPVELREQAVALLTENPGSTLPLFLVPLFQELMADALYAVGEFRRAIPFGEASIEYTIDLLDDPEITASALRRASKCYEKTGLRDHAAIPLRAAVKILRTLAGDPRLPSALLDLGNALRKSNPTEAEQCYREVAEFHVAKAHLESATPAWVNLGVLCNEQGRYAESLEFYENALRVREQSPGTPPKRIGVILNNIANTRRKMEQFAEAHTSADRAREFLEPLGGHTLACAYGTKGLIYRDEQRDADAVEWFRRSAAEHRKMTSPNLSTLSEEIENEAAALERLAGSRKRPRRAPGWNPSAPRSTKSRPSTAKSPIRNPAPEPPS
jgi:tetratricopeptide (TPR) repeat protein